MESATCYDEWKDRALAEDRRTGAEDWKAQEACELYDHEVIRWRYDELLEIRRSGDPHRLCYYLNEGLHGNMGGMGSSALYARARFGTKQLVTRYVSELCGALGDFEAADERDIPFAEKLALLRRLQACFGRSALMLSGAGSLGAFHMGVARALSEQGLIPDVVSGASAGSVIAAMIGTHPEAELPGVFSRDAAARCFDLLRGPAPAGRRRRLRIDNLRQMIETTIPDLTFIEAWERTGRRINVSVAPSRLHQRSRLLNAVTSPNAFVREAVLASCAVPGVFPPVTLAARDRSGARRPYISSRQWVDGSITDDLPARRLSRLYGVNHFISSQANPVTLWALQDPHGPESLRSRLLGISVSASQDWLRAVYPFTLRVVRGLHPVSTYTRMLFSVLTQDYSSDIIIVPRRRLYRPDVVLAALSPEEVDALVQEGERATWPKVEIIRNCTKVGRCLDEIVARLELAHPRVEAESA